MSTVTVQAGIKLPEVFSDGMVFQRREKCPVWGWEPGGGEVTVFFRDRKVTAEAAADGAWRVDVDAGEAGGPFTLAVQGSGRIEITDVYVGEVWLVSGQSNAGQTPEEPYFAPSDDPAGVHIYTAGLPGKDGNAKWATDGIVGMLGWHFGREMRKRLGIPVGIIISAVGASCVEQWKPGTDAGIAQAGPAGEITGEAGGLYEKLIVPLQPFRIKGVVWWQGESNVDNANTYYGKFISLIGVWRRDWGQGDFPFLWVQLQRIVRSGPDWWLRIADGRSTVADAQRRALSVKNSAMVVSYDITEGDLHPPDPEKKIIANRLVLAAGTLAYGGHMQGSGPLPDKMVCSEDRLLLTFTQAEDGLEVRDNLTVRSTDLKGFEIKSAKIPFAPVKARLEGATVFISVAGLNPPFAVRYAWGPQPEANLYNRAGLPAPTFIIEDNG